MNILNNKSVKRFRKPIGRKDAHIYSLCTSGESAVDKAAKILTLNKILIILTF